MLLQYYYNTPVLNPSRSLVPVFPFSRHKRSKLLVRGLLPSSGHSFNKWKFDMKYNIKQQKMSQCGTLDKT